MPQPRTPLYVRLAAEETHHLERAVAASGKSKRQLVEDAVREHLTDDGLVVGRATLREALPEVLTLSETAALLRLEEEVVVSQAAEPGGIPGRRIGEHWRFSRQALLAWLAGRES
ncbi:MAG: helix-turn-helix domain-containing protein [Actinomycetota bacterium]|nr:helix-turn-helix domain-containing protein [Actinomycetota bacterium]